ncbi:glycoside hydrolase family 2 TIM barrel-domain containing protein [Streptococcus hyointestinalis]|uniref:glycoside hydrolase family 2 TIM barrel-domain containing protein n=1 Tax=Streptococcus hyointestinalis TaxID=1337 RepID=UPI0013DEFE92|nr:glycoside hydrolase family 2 TIM barrel-domain containing protein [Streptococcus hyointestinalis]
MLLDRVFHEDMTQFHVHTLPRRNYYIPYSDQESARRACLRQESNRFVSLNGSWQFAYFPSLAEIMDEDIAQLSASLSETIWVPSVWQYNGYDQLAYLNERFAIPFDVPYVPCDNPCALYQRNFKVSSEDRARFDYHLTFEGVDSCFYLWVNSQFVGYSQISHSLSEFDITPHLYDGDNILNVLVLKWCDGTYLEAQDKFRVSGIFRDVYLLKRDKDSFYQYRLHQTTDSKAKTALLSLELDNWESAVPYLCYAPSGELVAKGDDLTQIELTSISLWSAECPKLYTLLLHFGDEWVCERIGFRELTITDGVFYLNQAPIKLYGVNHHDSNPLSGPCVTLEEQKEDLLMMKKHHINAIRTSHYPKSPEFYQLCDELGFYVMSEADIEMHGIVSLYGLGGYDNYNQLANDSRFLAPILDRLESSIVPLVNMSSIFSWSLGNESGFGTNFEEGLRLVKALDASRLRHYEGYFHADSTADGSLLDVHSRMYASLEDIELHYLQKRDKPFLLCEYSHAMGNSCGDLFDYDVLMQAYPNFLGGFVWEWCDHAFVLEKEGKQVLRYGGDSGEEVHDGHFCVDGLVSPDRLPHTSLALFKQMHCPFKIDKLADGTLLLKNTYFFTATKSDLRLLYQLVVNGEVVKEHNEAIVDMPARSELKLLSPFTNWQEYHGRVDLRVHFIWLGEEAGVKSICLREVTPDLSSFQKENKPQSWQATEYAARIELKRGEMSVTFDKRTGFLSQVKLGDTAYLTEPMQLIIWRAPTDNDTKLLPLWKAAGYDRVRSRAYETSLLKTLDSIVLETSISLAAAGVQSVLRAQLTWTFRSDGAISLSAHFIKDKVFPSLPRLGLQLVLPKEMAQLSYMGNGPKENYSDKRQASYFGRFETRVSEMREAYIYPQESGNRCQVYAARLRSQDLALSVVSQRAISFNASPYSLEELTRCSHIDLLRDSQATYLYLDVAQAGIGSHSCGPELPERYQLGQEHYDLEVTFWF